MFDNSSDCLFENATFFTPVSMAAIEGKQTAQKVLDSLWGGITNYLNKDEATVNSCTILTPHLYNNVAHKPAHQQRHSNLRQTAKFIGKFWNHIDDRSKTNPHIVRDGYNITSWDSLLYYKNAVINFVQQNGRLKNALTTNHHYADILTNTSDELNRPHTPAQQAFLTEEFAFTYGLITKTLQNPTYRSLHKSNNGPACILYPSPIMAAEIMSYQLLLGKGKAFAKGQAYHIDVSNPDTPAITDYADAINHFTATDAQSVYLTVSSIKETA